MKESIIMINGTLKNKVDAIRQDFFNENMAQSSDVVNHLTMLMFIKMLDDKQNALEAQAAIIKVEPKQEDLTFKKGNYKHYETVNGEKIKNFEIPYADLRWKNFKNLNSHDLCRRIRDYVIPFIKDENNKAVGKFSYYSTKYTFGFDDKERLLTAVVDKLSDPEFDFTKTDVMGDVYEYICGSGISGQFRTPRHIIDLAVEMMKPKLGEKIIDPAMGTAGFVIESAKYIQQHQKDDLLSVENKKMFNSSMFYGCDNDTNMARIGYMNCILHNIKDPQITTKSLLEQENSQDYFGQFDLVLQNPPFAGSLVDNKTSGKLLTITNTKKTELLFVTLMLQLMKLGGRGMSIVPDGVLFGSSNAHVSLRKELVDHQKLIGVISMPQGIFMAPTKKGSSSKGAGVKTSYLIFQRTDNGGTDNVWFYDMEADGYTLDVKRTETENNDIPDIINRFNNLDKEVSRKRTEKSFMVPVEEIREMGYDLTINKYKTIITEPVKYPSSAELLAEIEKLDATVNEEMAELKKLLMQ